MGHPVTTNPFIIMLINMTVVFIVLISLSFLIQAIHYFDPTKPKEVEPEPVAEKPSEPEPVPVVEEGISAETIAVIFAAVAAYGYDEYTVRAVRMINHENTPWRQAGRFNEHALIHEHHEMHEHHHTHH